ncbi:MULTISPECIES: ABC transporter substrate-binding protein [Brevibacterium]|jgi:polar amino acid transport system substrate-binding protein|uniref:ABC transporter substrate-binding protein n=1 Tax=Brevibacterium salitolerans TaxID=1403566 RepID=A0ABN2X5D5_9MICO|nr:ABC transporter substrate-binding protein [Brevibacterium sp.]
MRRAAGTAIAVAALMCAVAGCTPVKTETTGALAVGDDVPLTGEIAAIAQMVPEDVAEDGALTVVTSDGMAPLNVPDTATGEVEGFNPDLARQVGAVLGLEVDIHAVTLDQIIPGIEAGRYETTFSNMSIEPERLEVLDFVQYYFSSTGLGVLAGNPAGVDPERLCGKTVGVATGSFQMTKVLPDLSEECRSEGLPPVDVSAFPDQQKAALALLSGRVDATSMDGPVLAFASAQEPRIEEGARMTEGSNVGIGVPKDTGMAEAMSAAVQELMDNGVYERLLDKYGMRELGIDEAKVER